MSTKIEWTDEVWNPVTGCEKVSQGCKNCYAETIANRFWGDRKFTDVQMHPVRLDIPLRWKKPRRVFVNSMSDLFHEDVTSSFIDDVFRVMYQAKWHTFQVLTKRPERMVLETRIVSLAGTIRYPMKNVWLGVSCEDQKAADERIPLLLQTPAAVRFVSLEPLLGTIDLSPFLFPWHTEKHLDTNPPKQLYKSLLDWVIVGGESGPHARPMHPDWARSIRDQCQAAEVPFFFKQWGEWTLKSQKPPGTRIVSNDFGVLTLAGKWFPSTTGWNGRDIDPDTGEAYMVRVGKETAGRLLDGREWNEYPEEK